MKQFDYLVLGSGLAGLFSALKVTPRRAASFPVTGRIFMGAVLAVCSAFTLPAASLQFTQVGFVPTGIQARLERSLRPELQRAGQLQSRGLDVNLGPRGQSIY